MAVTDKSGASGIVHFLNDRLALRGASRVDKRHPGIERMVKWVDTQYSKGRTSALSDEELMSMAMEHLPELFSEKRRQALQKKRQKG